MRRTGSCHLYSFVPSTRVLRLWLIGSLSLVILAGCQPDGDRLFQRRPAAETGVYFSNDIIQDDTLMNPLDYLYLYNGGGVGIGDLNEDGRPDLYFAGNMVENRLYLNDGNFQFRDVTTEAGAGAPGVWSTGVTMVDINQDGLLDIYVSAGGPPQADAKRANRLFVNQGVDSTGVPTFDERATAYGIASTDYTTHAAFFDYDQDGDLDLYLLTNAMQDGNQNAFDQIRTNGEAKSTDHLYRNEGDGTFTDVSAEAGIRSEGYGLGIAIADLNADGWPDVYVANDFTTNDLLYINQKDGTFVNRAGDFLKHQSYSAMGVDLADINNDQRVDIMTLDMLPPENPRLRLMPRAPEQEAIPRRRRLGYDPQIVQNTLQLNNGPTPGGGYTFSEIAYLAGVHATDWSWAPLLADFDNDADRDLFVTNGYGEDVTNLDYVQKREEVISFGDPESNRKRLLQEMDKLSEVRLPNRFFENQEASLSGSGETLRFTDRTGIWVARRPGISNGAAYGDLDHDGDLDLVTNNINAKATLLENRANERPRSHSLQVRLQGPDPNRTGLGTKLWLYGDSTVQFHQHSRYRGYQSSVGSVVHFGLGADSTADSLVVRWPDGTVQTRTAIRTGEVVNLQHPEISDTTVVDRSPVDSTEIEEPPAQTPYLFREVASNRGLTFDHKGPPRGREYDPLLPHSFTHGGPGVAVGDVDGNGLDDVFVGGDWGQNGVLFLQNESSTFARHPFPSTSRYDDQGALFFDADQDGDLDLYLVAGGGSGAQGSAAYQDRLYLNDGDANFEKAPESALPDVRSSGSVVTAADYDQDGDLDLFVGGKARPHQYPKAPRSVLLRNNSETGTVTFSDVTTEVAPGLARVGLVRDALWTDYDTDGDRDLMIAGEWMPITVFSNRGGRFTEVTEDSGLSGTSGWWNSLESGDFDRDGDTDYIAGNVGLNTNLQNTAAGPVRIYANDYDGNGKLDPILTRMIDGTRYPMHGRDAITNQIPGLKSRFRTYRSYAAAPFSEVFTAEEREGALVKSAPHLQTSYIENRTGEPDANPRFEVRPLPRQTQLAPMFGLNAADHDGDGTLDLLLTGNWHGLNTALTGRADASVGTLLTGDGTGHFEARPYTESGFLVDGDAKALTTVATSGTRSLILASQNGDSLRAFSRQTRRDGTTIALRPDDQWASLMLSNGETRRVEFYWGSSYLSQSSRTLYIPSNVEQVTVHGSEGARRTVP